MRTEAQVKRRLNQLKELLKADEKFIKELGEVGVAEGFQYVEKEIRRAEDHAGVMRTIIAEFEWVLNAPEGDYHV